MKRRKKNTGNAVSVLDVAKYTLRKIGPITAMKLQKLVYYCQAWSLVWDEEPIFKERIEAWANGPVVRKLFEAHKGKFKVNHTSIIGGNIKRLNDTQRETIEAVLDYYGNKSSQWLSDLTHKEAPWRDARAGLADSERGNREITHPEMHLYYDSLRE